MRREPALDGLRAVAVLAVMAEHTTIPLAQAGYLGVDVFFVLSGYLITRILLQEHGDTGRLRLAPFYARRALRLYPALLAVVLLTTGFVLVGWIDGSDHPRHGLVALTYLQDLDAVLDWSERPGPLFHTWSLAVEEHFYLLWPPVLLLLSRRGPRWVAGASIGGGLVCFAVMQLAFVPTDGPTSLVYFRPDARSAALLLGCWLATRPRTPLPAAAGWLALAALGGALLLSPLANTRAAFAVSMPLVWVATAVLIRAVTAGPSPVRAMLSLRPLVVVGGFSYGLYLYHPVLVDAGDGAGLRWAVGAPLAIVAAFAVAAASHRWVEQPFLRRKRRFEHDDRAAVTTPAQRRPPSTEPATVDR